MLLTITVRPPPLARGLDATSDTYKVEVPLAAASHAAKKADSSDAAKAGGRVSFCLGFNLGAPKLTQAVAALAAMDHSGFRVKVVPDGSASFVFHGDRVVKINSGDRGYTAQIFATASSSAAAYVEDDLDELQAFASAFEQRWWNHLQ